MTATSNAPLYVSINPTLAADIETAITAIREQVIAEERSLKAAGLTAAQKRESKKLIAAGEQQMADLKSQMPATFLDEAAAIAFVIAELRTIDNYDAVKAEFIAKVEEDPTYAIEWRAGTMVAAQFRRGQMYHFFEHVATVTTMADLVEAIKELRRIVLEELLRRVRGASGSTNAFDNTIEACKAEAAKELYENKLQWALHKAEFFAEQVKTTAPIRDLYLRVQADVARMTADY